MLDYGIEIEAILPPGVSYQQLAVIIEGAGVPCYYVSYSHTTERAKWKVVTDGSLSAGVGGGSGVEVVSPPLTEAGFDQIEKVCRALASIGARVNRSCGLHVHIGARTLSVPTLKKLASLYIENEPVIDRLLPPSRRGNANNYCKSITGANVAALASASDLRGITNAIGGGRYVKLNFEAFWRHGTVEFRQHSGTIDAVKIIEWIKFCSKMVAAAAREASTPIPVPAGTTLAPSPYWRKGRQRRALFTLLSRPEGVTSEELQRFLQERFGSGAAKSNIRGHLARAGSPFRVIGRRNRCEVFQLQTTSVAAVTTEAATLESLCTKLAFDAAEKAFWEERFATLQPEAGPMPITSNTMRRAGQV